MFTIIRKSSNNYVLANHKENLSLDLDENGVICYLRDQEIALDEIESALSALIRHNHVVAEFGSLGSFLYSRTAISPELVIQ